VVSFFKQHLQNEELSDYYLYANFAETESAVTFSKRELREACSIINHCEVLNVKEFAIHTRRE